MMFSLAEIHTEWCRKNVVRMSFYAKQGETHMMNCVELKKDDIRVEAEYSLGIRQIVIDEAISLFEDLMRAKARNN